jgi:hypothetical protein
MLEMQEFPPQTTAAIVPAAAHALAASSAMVTLYVDPDPATPAGSTQSVYVWPCPFEWTLHKPEVQHGEFTQVVRFDSHPSEGSVVQWPKPVLQVRLQLLSHEPLMGLQHVVPLQMTDPVFCA